MKLICLLVLLLLLQFPFLSGAQNLVYNGNFETYSQCPNNSSQLPYSLGWRAFTLLNSTDYYHTCGSSNNCSVPTNIAGYQVPASGNAYIGFINFMSPLLTFNTIKEYAAGLLIAPLQVGIPYEVSMSVSRANNEKYGSDDLGAFFYKNGPSVYNIGIGVPAVVPQITYSGYGPITDTLNWVRVSSVFVADSSYENIVVGGWKEAASCNILPNTPNISGWCYYLIDSVVVRIGTKISTYYMDTALCVGQSINVPYTIAAPLGYFTSGNMYKLQLSDALGSFTSPTTLASQPGTASGTITATIPVNTPAGTGYRLRIVSTNTVDSSNYSLKPITITNVLPAKPVITSNTPVCAGNTLVLSAATSTPGVNYVWTGPNGFYATNANPTIVSPSLLHNGDYIVSTWLGACSSKDTETVMVKQMPMAIYCNSNSPVCEGSSLNLTVTNSTPGATYSWAGPNGFTSTQQNPSVVNSSVSTTGDYIATADLNGCIAKDTTTTSLQSLPSNISATSNSPICNGQALNLNVSSTTSGITYSWQGPNSFTSSGQAPSVSNAIPAMSGDYIATLTLNGCSGKDTVNVIVYPIPPIPTVGSNTPVCSGTSINLTATGLPGTVYNWTGPNTFTSGIQNPVISNANPGMTGTYSVTATVNGCTSPLATTAVNVLYFPSSVTAYPIPNDTICVGGTTQFVAVASNGGTNPQYKWMKNGNIISGANAISYTASNMITGDKFAAILTPDNSCPDPDTSAAIEVSVLPYVTPSVSITASPGTLISPWQTITFTAVPVNGGKNPTYQWKRNGQNIVGAVNDTWGAYTLSNNDTISVELFSSEYCPVPASATSNKIVVAVKTGVDDLNREDGFVLYPNPNNGSFTMEGNIGTNAPVGFEIINVLGQVVYRGTLSPKNNYVSQTIQLPNTAKGIYMLNMHMAKGHYSRRFSIE